MPVDVYQKMAHDRILFITDYIDDQIATDIIATLLLKDQGEDSDKEITLFINSPGGDIRNVFMIYDVMQMIRAPIKTVCLGKCYSAGAVMLAAGTAGERYAFKSSKVMIHGIQGIFPIPGHDMTNTKNYYEFMRDHNDTIMKMLAHHTGQPLAKVKEDCLRDVWLDAKQALAYGIIDHIIP
jgi:ATP-dependent Clp protease protease subunit